MIVKAVMVPHPPIAVREVGRGEEKKIQKTLDAYEQAMQEVADAAPDTIIISSPHATMYRDYFQISSGDQAYGDLAQFNAGGVRFEIAYDEELTRRITELLSKEGIPGGTEYERDRMLDHGTMVPLYFLRNNIKRFRYVRIGLSGLPLDMHYQLGQAAAQAAEQLGRRIAWVASGDLAHCQKQDGPYGYQPEGPEYDARIMDTMGRGAFGELLEYDENFCQKAMECGHRSFVMMAGALDRTDVTPHVLSHENTFGVGYGVVVYDIGGPDAKRNFLDQYEQEEADKASRLAEKEDAYVRLARQSLTSWVRDRHILKTPEDLPEALRKTRAGAFVSLHEHGSLRGCIGTIAATRRSLAEEIIHNAVSACSRDPRFEPVEAKELPFLEISVDVLGDAEPVASAEELDPRRYGVIVRKDQRQGLLLPDLDGVDTADQQIRIACSKAGIDPQETGIELSRFEVVRHV